MNFLTPIRTLGKFTIKHGPTLMAVGAAGGVVATGVTAAEAGARYQETGKKTEFVKPVIIGATTIAGIFMSDRLHVRRYTALAGAASVIQRQYDKYVNAAEGDVHSLIQDDRDTYSAEDIWKKCQKNGISPIDTHTGTKLWFEPVSEQFFLASSDHVTQAINRAVETFECADYYVFGEFLRDLELPRISGYNNLIWDRELGGTFYGYSQVLIGMKDKKLRDGTEYTQIDYMYDPHLGEK